MVIDVYVILIAGSIALIFMLFELKFGRIVDLKRMFRRKQ